MASSLQDTSGNGKYISSWMARDLNLGFMKLSFSFSSHSCCCSQLLSAQGTLAISLTHSQQHSRLTPGSTLRDPSCWSSGIFKWCQEGTHSSCVQDRVLPAVLSFSELRQHFIPRMETRDPFPHRSSLLEDSAVSSCVPGRWGSGVQVGKRHQGPALICTGLCKPSLRTSEWDGASHRLHIHIMMDKWGAGVSLVQVHIVWSFHQRAAWQASRRERVKFFMWFGARLHVTPPLTPIPWVRRLLWGRGVEYL